MQDNIVCVCVSSSISEEEPGPLRSDTEGKNVTKVSRTFSYLKNKMYKKTRVRKHRDLNSSSSWCCHRFVYSHYTVHTTQTHQSRAFMCAVFMVKSQSPFISFFLLKHLFLRARMTEHQAAFQPHTAPHSCGFTLSHWELPRTSSPVGLWAAPGEQLGVVCLALGHVSVFVTSSILVSTVDLVLRP